MTRLQRIIYLICVLLVMQLACTISTEAVSSVNTASYITTEHAYKKPTLARPPAPALDGRGEKGLP